MSARWVIRPERAADFEGIRLVNCLAFGGEAEAHLVDRLRSDGLMIESLVCASEAGILGHVIFSRLPIVRDGGCIEAAALAPVAVHPNWQHQGIGTALIEAGLARCRRSGVRAVIVLGNPAYYSRFGFSAEPASELVAPYSGPAFMALEYEPGVLAAGGTVVYPEAFTLVD